MPDQVAPQEGAGFVRRMLTREDALSTVCFGPNGEFVFCIIASRLVGNAPKQLRIATLYLLDEKGEEVLQCDACLDERGAHFHLHPVMDNETEVQVPDNMTPLGALTGEVLDVDKLRALMNGIGRMDISEAVDSFLLRTVRDRVHLMCGVPIRLPAMTGG